MANHGYYRVPQDELVALRKRLTEEAPWSEIDIAAFQDAADHLAISALPLLKLRLTRRVDGLVSALGTASNALTRLDASWDLSQRKLLRRIEEAEDEADAALKDAGARLRAALTSGEGLGQTKLSFKEEVAFGEKQVALARAPKTPGASVPSLAEDVALLGVGPVIDEIERRTRELSDALKQVPEEAQNTSRYARVRAATASLVDSLNAAHDELEEQIEAAKSPEIRDRLKKLLGVLEGLIPSAPVTAAKVG
jgi:hypothetical protein